MARKKVTRVKCENCGWSGPESKMKCSIEECADLNERLDPGSEVPAGECPKCEAFCYIHNGAANSMAKCVAFTTAFLAAFRELGTDEPLNGADAVDRLADLYDVAKNIFPEEAARLVKEIE